MASQEEIMGMERKFWQALVDMDVDIAVAMLDEVSTVAGMQGVVRFTPDEYKAMALSGDARVTSFEFSDERVVFPTPHVAIASYKARQAFTMGGKNHEMVVYDTTTWVEKNGRWLAAAHTETPESTELPPSA